LFFVGVLLLVSLLSGNVLLTLGLSLSYENVNNELSYILTDVILGGYNDVLPDTEINLTERVDEGFEFMEEYCENNTEFVYSEGEYTFTIPCDIVEKGPEQIINQSISSAVDEVYYKEYNCEFWDCFGEEDLPFFLASEKAKEYWTSKFYLALIVSSILSALALLLIENRRNFPIVLGSLMAVSALPFMKLNSFVSFFDGVVVQFISVFISEARTVFLIFFISGLILIGLGIALHFVKAGFSIAEWIKKKRGMKSAEIPVKASTKK